MRHREILLLVWCPARDWPVSRGLSPLGGVTTGVSHLLQGLMLMSVAAQTDARHGSHLAWLSVSAVVLVPDHARQQRFNAGLGDFDVRQGPVDALNGEREPLVHLPLFLDDGIVRLVLLVLHRQHGRETPQNLIVLTEML